MIHIQDPSSGFTSWAPVLNTSGDCSNTKGMRTERSSWYLLPLGSLSTAMLGIGAALLFGKAFQTLLSKIWIPPPVLIMSKAVITLNVMSHKTVADLYLPPMGSLWSVPQVLELSTFLPMEKNVIFFQEAIMQIRTSPPKWICPRITSTKKGPRHKGLAGLCLPWVSYNLQLKHWGSMHSSPIKAL